MKKNTLRQKLLSIELFLSIIIIILIKIDFSNKSKIMLIIYITCFVLGVFGLISTNVLMFLKWRCPKCDKSLPYHFYSTKLIYCPYCGAEIDNERNK